ncbi:hypothetical protein EJ110_NYTH25463 [Nymphaea thermarum]|nr:hypothetical protein EJ110_NYTH25463 [Nymphaea thermarum]
MLSQKFSKREYKSCSFRDSSGCVLHSSFYLRVVFLCEGGTVIYKGNSNFVHLIWRFAFDAATLQLNRMWKWQVARKYHACRSVPWSRVLLVSSSTTTPSPPTSFFLWLGMRRATTSMGGENQPKEMGEGEEHKTRDDPKIEIQERGEIFFFYRPKVGREEAHSAGDVQRLYIVLRPESGDRAVEKKQESKSGKEGRKAQDDKGDEDGKGAPEGGRGEEEVNIERETLLRFLVLGRKSLPDPSKRSTPYWGFVELVTTKEYDTSTRGHRTKPSARALAKGVYRILKHVSGRRNHTHLVYKLECPTPDKPNEPQESLNIENEASFIIQIKNPTKPAPPNVGIQNKRKATFPAQLEALLGSKRFGPADPPDFLNYEGCEFLLIAASD